MFRVDMRYNGTSTQWFNSRIISVHFDCVIQLGQFRLVDICNEIGYVRSSLGYVRGGWLAVLRAGSPWREITKIVCRGARRVRVARALEGGP